MAQTFGSEMKLFVMLRESERVGRDYLIRKIRDWPGLKTVTTRGELATPDVTVAEQVRPIEARSFFFRNLANVSLGAEFVPASTAGDVAWR